MILGSNRQWVEKLERDVDKDAEFASAVEDNIVTVKRREDGTLAVTGSSGLKETQEYTDEFGEAVCAAWMEYEIGATRDESFEMRGSTDPDAAEKA